MRDDRQKSRLMTVGPIVALALIAIATLIAGVSTGAGAVVVGVIGVVLALAFGLEAYRSRHAGVVADSAVPAVPAGPSEELTGAVASASDLAKVRLPALAAAMADPGSTEDVARPFPVPKGDRTAADLVGSLNQIQTSVTDMIETQDQNLREGIGQLVVNLVRRNQSLLDKQLEQIDDLETSEEDPDRLEQLYGLDLLATRMRRNAESLLVLAGTEPPRRRNGEVSVSDIARVAVSEIENYRQVEFRSVDSGVVTESAVVDVAHLLSELLENATKFSPPDASVDIAGRDNQDGSYDIEVVDAGIGISEEKIADLNRMLADPPELGLDMSRSLGLMVVGKLAQRLDLSVTLRSNPDAGTTAVVHLPPELLVEGDADSETSEEPTEEQSSTGADLPSEPLAIRDRSSRATDADDPGSVPAAVGVAVSDDPVASIADEQQVDGDVETDGETDGETEPQPAAASAGTGPVEQVSVAERTGSLEEALPSGVIFEDGIESLLSPSAPGTNPSGAGLVKRDRSKNYAPAGEGRRVPDASQSPVAASNRKPEEIKQMLSRYRDARRRPVEAADLSPDQTTTSSQDDQGDKQ